VNQEDVYAPGEAPPPASLPQWASAPPAPQVAAPSDTLPRPRREYVEGLTRVGWAIALGSVSLAVARATHILPDWEAGRWWMFTIGFGIVAVLSGLLAVVYSVASFGEARRHSRAARGAGLAVLALLVGGALLVGAGVSLVDDWDRLDVPDAWDRIDLTPEKRGIVDTIDSARDRTAASGADVRRHGRIGGCYTGDAADPGEEVACREAHRLEVVVAIELPGSSDAYPGVAELTATALDLCREPVDAAVERDTTGLDLRALVPTEVEWLAGDHQAMCVFQFASPVTERVAE